METLISILVAIIGGLGFLLFRKSKQNTQLKADKDLTSQKERSKIVDEKVNSAEKKADVLSQKMKEPVEDSEEFWKKYGKK